MFGGLTGNEGIGREEVEGKGIRDRDRRARRREKGKGARKRGKGTKDYLWIERRQMRHI